MQQKHGSICEDVMDGIRPGPPSVSHLVCLLGPITDDPIWGFRKKIFKSCLCAVLLSWRTEAAESSVGLVTWPPCLDEPALKETIARFPISEPSCHHN